MAFGAAALVLTGVSLALSYQSAGAAGSVVGLLGILGMLASAAGFVLALRGFREEDVYYMSANIGVGLNGVLFLLWAFVCVVGM